MFPFSNLFILFEQTYLQRKTPAKLERMKQRKDYLEGWNPFFLLPLDLRREVTWCENQKWQKTTEVNLESLLNNTPTALRKKLRPYLCKDMLEKVSCICINYTTAVVWFH